MYKVYTLEVQQIFDGEKGPSPLLLDSEERLKEKEKKKKRKERKEKGRRGYLCEGVLVFDGILDLEQNRRFPRI
jgi:hypothetical protein